MPRYSRGVAQRYAARKRKKRLTARPSPPRTTSAAQEAEQSLPVPASERRASQPDPRRPVPVVHTVATSRARPTSRRPFAAYAEEYRYVAGDLRRVVVVAGSLLLFLVVLSFFIR